MLEVMLGGVILGDETTPPDDDPRHGVADAYWPWEDREDDPIEQRAEVLPGPAEPLPWERETDPLQEKINEWAAEDGIAPPPPDAPLGGEMPGPIGRTRAGEMVQELSALIGYDIEGLRHQFREQVEVRHKAKLELARLKAEAASYEARFGMRGQQSHYEHERSQRLAEIAEQVRRDYAANPEYKVAEKTTGRGAAKETVEERKELPLTDGRVDDLSRAHPDYKQYLGDSLAERRAYTDLLAQIDRAWADVEQAQGVYEFLRESIDTVRSLVYYAGKEWRVTDR